MRRWALLIMTLAACSGARPSPSPEPQTEPAPELSTGDGEASAEVEAAERAEEALDEDDYEEARRLAEEIAVDGTEDALVFEVLSKACFRLEDWQCAIDACDRGLALEELDDDFRALRARAVARVGDFERAVTSLEHALAAEDSLKNVLRLALADVLLVSLDQRPEQERRDVWERARAIVRRSAASNPEERDRDLALLEELQEERLAAAEPPDTRPRCEPPLVEARAGTSALPSATTQGALSVDVLRRIVRRHVNELRYCYGRLVCRNPDLSGEVVMRFSVTPEGEATSITAETADERLADCVASAVDRWTFPRETEGTHVTYPYRFFVND